MQFEATLPTDSVGTPDAGTGRSRFAGGGRWLRSVGILLTTVVVGGLVLASIGAWQFASLANARAYLQGYSVIPENTIVTLGNVESGTRVTAQLRLLNLTNRPVRVVGAESKCGCIAYEDLPIAIAPHSSEVMSAWFTAPTISQSDANHYSSEIKHPIHLLLDVTSPAVVVTLEAKAIPAQAPALAEVKSSMDISGK